MVPVLDREQREEAANRKEKKREHVAEEGTNTSMLETRLNSKCKAVVIAAVLFFMQLACN